MQYIYRLAYTFEDIIKLYKKVDNQICAERGHPMTQNWTTHPHFLPEIWIMQNVTLISPTNEVILFTDSTLISKNQKEVCLL